MRSGTSLMTFVLDAHPRISMIFETFLFPILRPILPLYGPLTRRPAMVRLVDDVRYVLARQGWDPPPEREELLQATATPSLASVYAAVLASHSRRTGSGRVGEKTPQHHAHLDAILDALPDAHVIFMVRDPRDTVRSTRSAFGTSLGGAIAQWRGAFASWRRYADRVETVRYEDLVGEPERTLRRVCDRIGEPYVSSMTEFHRSPPRGEQVDHPHHTRLQRPIDARSVGRWTAELPRPAVARVEAACRSEMEELGYEPLTKAGPGSGRGRAARPRGRLGFVIDRLRFYGVRPRRWRRGWIRWRIFLLRTPGWVVRRCREGLGLTADRGT